MSLGLRADPTNTSGVISVAGVDQVVITNASNVVATTFTGALAGNASSATSLSTSTGTAPVYGVRAWVAFNGFNNTSNVADATNTNRYIFGSGNVTNVLRNSTGNYTIFFSTAMPDANYSITAMSRQGAANNTFVQISNDLLPLATYVVIENVVATSSPVVADSDVINVMVVR